MLININGELVPEAQAKISVFDHGHLYGDGAFEGIRAYGDRVFKLYEHVDRLRRSAHYLDIAPLPDREALAQEILRTVRANEDVQYVRVTLTRGVGLGLDPKNIKNPQLIIIAAKLNLYPREMYENGLSVATVSVRVPPPHALEPRIKSLGKYVGNILAKLEANRMGAGEGLMLNSEGYVAEATGDNLFVIQNGALLTPPAYAGILEGITRATTMDLARKIGITVSEQQLTLFDVYNADECFLTGTAAEIIPAVKVDGRKIGPGVPGPITKRLMAEFRSLVAEEGVPIGR